MNDRRMSAQPLIAVRDVTETSRFYEELLGLTSGHGGAEYERLYDGDRLVLQIHVWDVEEHPNLVRDGASGRAGHGVLLWFEVPDFHRVVERARSLGAEIVQAARLNPNSRQMELWVRDPDGYVVVAAGPPDALGRRRDDAHRAALARVRP